MMRLLIIFFLLPFLLVSCTLFPSEGVAQQPAPEVRTNLLVSESDLTTPEWVINNLGIETINEQSSLLYPEPAPGFTYPLTSRLTVTSGEGTPSVYQVVTGAKQNHFYRMTAVLQGYSEGSAVNIRFARTLDGSSYPDTERSVTLNDGVQRVTFEFFLEDKVESFVLSLEPRGEEGHVIDVGELRVWDSTPSYLANEDGGCVPFPSNNFWNVPVDDWTVHPNSNKFLRGLRNGENLVRDGYYLRMGFGARSYRNGPVGKPLNIVLEEETPPQVYDVTLKFVPFTDPAYPPAPPFDAFRSSEFRQSIEAYPRESDDVVYPIPADIRMQGLPMEGVMDLSNNRGYPTDSSGYPDPAIDPDVNKDWPAYVIEKTKDRTACRLYEIYKLTKIADQPFEEAWRASSAVRWDLGRNVIEGKRGEEFLTSVSASGLPLTPGLVRYEEIQAGEIKHAIGMITRGACGMVWPARHIADTDDGNGCVPLGLRLRLKDNFLNSSKHTGCTLNNFSKEGKLILLALQRYGAIIVDSGGVGLTIIGEHNSMWGPSVDRFGNNIGGSNKERQVDISNESSLNNCWPRIEDFEVVDTDRYAHWSFATDGQGDVIRSRIYTVYNNQPVYNSMAVYGE